MKKLNVILGALIGFLNGVFFYFVLKQVGQKLPYPWLLIVVFPLLGVLGLFITSLVPILFQAAKFFLVGTLNTFINLGVLNFLMWTSGVYKGILYSVFVAISFLAATINSYFWNKLWTFEKRERSQPKEFFKFLTVTFVGLLINVSVASFIVNVIGPRFEITEKIWASIGAIVAAFFAFVWNFLGSKFIVFKK